MNLERVNARVDFLCNTSECDIEHETAEVMGQRSKFALRCCLVTSEYPQNEEPVKASVDSQLS